MENEGKSVTVTNTVAPDPNNGGQMNYTAPAPGYRAAQPAPGYRAAQPAPVYDPNQPAPMYEYLTVFMNVITSAYRTSESINKGIFELASKDSPMIIESAKTVLELVPL